MVSVFRKIACTLAKLFLLVQASRTDGGMEVATPPLMATPRHHVRTVATFVARMDGAATGSSRTMVAPITNRHSTSVPIAIAPPVLALATRVQVEILILILASITHARIHLARAVDCLQIQNDLNLVFLMQQGNAML